LCSSDNFLPLPARPPLALSPEALILHASS
jgi:hypothetical protein